MVPGGVGERSFENLRYLGQAKRYQKTKHRPLQVDVYFQDFLSKRCPEYVLKYGPAVLSRNAYYKALSKYDRSQPSPQAQAWELSYHWLVKHFNCIRNTKIIEYDEARKYVDGPRSPSYPFTVKYHTKADVLKLPAFKAWLMKRIEASKKGEPFNCFWSLSLKDENRPLEKIWEESTRLFCVSPVDLYMFTLMYCADFNEKFYASHDKTWSFVGGTKYRCGFDELYRRLDRLPFANSTDASRWDASMFAEAMWDVMLLRYQFLSPEFQTEEHLNALKAIYTEFICSVMVGPWGDVWQKFTGNPSGSANTIVDNTLVNFRYKAYAWILLAPPEKRTYDCFMRHVEAALNGDDDLYTLDSVSRPILNVEATSVVYKRDLMVELTKECDNESLASHRFLSCQFHKYKDFYIPLPDYDKMVCAMLFTERQSVTWSLLRCLAFRVETWAHPGLRALFEDYFQYLTKHFTSFPTVVVKGISITERDVFQSYFNYEEIERLYLGYQCRSYGKTNTAQKSA